MGHYRVFYPFGFSIVMKRSMPSRKTPLNQAHASFRGASLLVIYWASLANIPTHLGRADEGAILSPSQRKGSESSSPSTFNTEPPSPKNEVRITVDGERRSIESNGWPDHAPGSFPRRGNPNAPRPQTHRFHVPLRPVAAPEPIRSRGGWWGVAVNGVPFEPGTGEAWNNDMRSGWRYEAATGFLNLGLDEHHAHVQPSGAYHYHALPNGLIHALGGDDSKMLLIAWAADGYPVYSSRAHADAQDAASPLRAMKPSYRLRKGPRPQASGAPDGNHDGRFTEDFEFVKGSGDLDECNGREGVTPEFPNGTYYYCITAQFPFVPRMWRGLPDPSFAKAGPPPGGGPGGRGRPLPPGGGPRGILEGGPGPRPQP